jgi:hypothetical protein
VDGSDMPENQILVDTGKSTTGDKYRAVCGRCFKAWQKKLEAEKQERLASVKENEAS